MSEEPRSNESPELEPVLDVQVQLDLPAISDATLREGETKSALNTETCKVQVCICVHLI